MRSLSLLLPPPIDPAPRRVHQLRLYVRESSQYANAIHRPSHQTMTWFPRGLSLLSCMGRVRPTELPQRYFGGPALSFLGSSSSPGNLSSPSSAGPSFGVNIFPRKQIFESVHEFCCLESYVLGDERCPKNAACAMAKRNRKHLVVEFPPSTTPVRAVLRIYRKYLQNKCARIGITAVRKPALACPVMSCT